MNAAVNRRKISNPFVGKGCVMGFSYGIRVALSAFLLGSPSVFAAAKSVATTGELSSAVSSASPGDTIEMKDGNWGAVTVNGKGSDGHPIVVRAQTPGKAMMTSSITISGEWVTVSGLNFQGVKGGNPPVIFENAAHCRFTDGAIVNCSNSGRLVHFRLPGTYNRFDHSYISNHIGSGQSIQVEVDPKIPNYHRIDHSFFGNRAQGNGNGFETFRIGYSHQQFNISRTTVDHSMFFKCNGESEVISSKSCENRYIYNTFLNNNGHLANRHGSRSWIEGNFFLNCPGGGVRVIDSGHVLVNNYFEGNGFGVLIYKGVATSDVKSYKQVVGGLIAFNTFINNGIQVGGGSGSLIPRDVKISNNVAFGSGTFVTYSVNPTNFSYEGNMGTMNGGSAAGFIKNDPKLTKGPDGIYRPDAGSPLKDAAVGSYDSISGDINAWVRDAKKDVGNFEIGAGTVQAKPLTEKDVGPSWMGNNYDVNNEDGSVGVRLAPAARSRVPARAKGVVLLLEGDAHGRLSDLLGRGAPALASDGRGGARAAAGVYIADPRD